GDRKGRNSPGARYVDRRVTRRSDHRLAPLHGGVAALFLAAVAGGLSGTAAAPAAGSSSSGPAAPTKPAAAPGPASEISAKIEALRSESATLPESDEGWKSLKPDVDRLLALSASEVEAG